MPRQPDRASQGAAMLGGWQKKSVRQRTSGRRRQRRPARHAVFGNAQNDATALVIVVSRRHSVPLTAPVIPVIQFPPESEMTHALKTLLCRLLAVTLMMLSFQSAQAGMIGTEQMHAASNAQLDRNVVTGFLGRAQTVSEMQRLGLDSQTAVERVAAMSDAEVASLAGNINAAPVGADGLVALILIGFIVWYFVFRR